MKINIVGDGISANLLAYYLKKRDGNLEINQFFENNFVKPTSENSTSIVALRNTQNDINELGLKLYNSFYETENFFKTEKSKFIEKSIHYQIGYEDDANYTRRFFRRTRDHKFYKLSENEACWSEDCYLFESNKFLDELRAKNIKSGVKRIIKYVDRPFENDEYNVYCVGANIQNFFDEPVELGHKQNVIGHYLEFSGYEFEHSFSTTYHKVNIIYRKSDKLFMIGTSSGDDFLEKSSWMKLEQAYGIVKGLFLRSEINLPELQEFRLKSGIRAKGIRRLPSWGRCLKPGNYAISNLYKNGFSLGFLAAKELSQEIYDNIFLK